MNGFKNNLLSDPLVPVLLIFSFIFSLILYSHISKLTPPSQILGISAPVNAINDCRLNQCGFCRNCSKGINCGSLSRCVNNYSGLMENGNNFTCRFDLECFKYY